MSLQVEQLIKHYYYVVVSVRNVSISIHSVLQPSLRWKLFAVWTRILDLWQLCIQSTLYV